MKRNCIPEGFLKKYRHGPDTEKPLYLPLKTGFLKLEYGLYDNPGILSLVSFVRKDRGTSPAVGPRLEMILTESGQGDQVTFITENGVSGLQWENGKVIWGHTYDDDSGPTKGKKTALNEWVDEMIDDMINPTRDEMDE